MIGIGCWCCLLWSSCYIIDWLLHLWWLLEDSLCLNKLAVLYLLFLQVGPDPLNWRQKVHGHVSMDWSLFVSYFSLSPSLSVALSSICCSCCKYSQCPRSLPETRKTAGECYLTHSSKIVLSGFVEVYVIWFLFEVIFNSLHDIALCNWFSVCHQSILLLCLSPCLSVCILRFLCFRYSGLLFFGLRFIELVMFLPELPEVSAPCDIHSIVLRISVKFAQAYFTSLYACAHADIDLWIFCWTSSSEKHGTVLIPAALFECVSILQYLPPGTSYSALCVFCFSCFSRPVLLLNNLWQSCSCYSYLPRQQQHYTIIRLHMKYLNFIHFSLSDVGPLSLPLIMWQ